MDHAMPDGGRLIAVQFSDPTRHSTQRLVCGRGNVRFRAEEFPLPIAHFQLSVGFSYPIGQNIQDDMFFAVSFVKQAQFQ